MADLHVDDDKLRELLEKAVSKMLAEKQDEINRATSKFLEGAEDRRRNAMKELEESGEKFQTRARETLKDADSQLASFNTALELKRKKVEDALNLKVIGGFTAVMIVAALGAISFLGERAVAVNGEAKKVSDASAMLKQASADLQTSIDAANEVYKKVAESAKGTDATAQLQTLSLLTTRMDSDIKTINGQIQKLEPDVKLLMSDYKTRHNK